MIKNLTVGMILADFCEQFSSYEDSMVFVEYVGAGCIDVYLQDSTYIQYSYDEHDIVIFKIGHSFQDYWLPRYDDRLFPLSESSYRERFAVLLRGRMYAQHISRKWLAERTGISEMSLYRYMRGERTPSSYSIYILNYHLRNSEDDPWVLT